MKKTTKIIPFTRTNLDMYNADIDKKDNYIGEKIALARKEKHISFARFCKLLEEYGISVTASAVQKWESGASIINGYQLLAVAHALNISDVMEYFSSSGNASELNAEGLRKVAAYKDDLIASGKYKLTAPVKDIVKYIDMRVSCLAVSAGIGEFLDDDNFETVSFPESAVPEGAEFGIRVSGDSMEPVYHDGQIVWVQCCDHLNVGEVGIFSYDGDGYLKMYNEQIPDDSCKEAFTDSYGEVHAQPVLISFNRKYAPKVVSANARFQIVGRVL